MPKKSFSLTPEGPEELELTWQGFWKNLTARVNGQRILVFVNATALKAGAVARLANGSELSIRLQPGLLRSRLEMLLDGTPLPGSEPAGKRMLKGRAWGIWSRPTT